MRRILILLVTAAIGGGAFAVSAGAQGEIPKNPVQACAWLQANIPDFYEFLNTKPGACVSTVASVGIDGLMNGEFPSVATAIGNCKFLEQNVFAPSNPSGSPYPYAFHTEIPGLLAQLFDAGAITQEQYAQALAYYESIAPELVAKNRAGCVSVLRLLHGGILAPIDQLFPPEG